MKHTTIYASLDRLCLEPRPSPGPALGEVIAKGHAAVGAGLDGRAQGHQAGGGEHRGRQGAALGGVQTGRGRHLR